jgi:hypothetical protein
MVEPKTKLKKTGSIAPVEEEEKVEAEVEAEPRSEEEEETLGRLNPRTSVIHTCYHSPVK